MSDNLLTSYYLRKSGNSLSHVYKRPDVMEVHQHSFEYFFQRSKGLSFRKVQGLHKLFGQLFSNLFDYYNLDLKYVGYYFNEHELLMSPENCKARNQTYGASLVLRVRQQSGRGQRSIVRDINLGVYPFPTNKGTLIIDGVERGVITEYFRTPGFYVDNLSEELISSKILFAGWPKVSIVYNKKKGVLELSHLGSKVIGYGGILSAFYGVKSLSTLIDGTVFDWLSLKDPYTFNLKKFRFSFFSNRKVVLDKSFSFFKKASRNESLVSYREYVKLLSLKFSSKNSNFCTVEFLSDSLLNSLRCLYSKENIYLFSCVKTNKYSNSALSYTERLSSYLFNFENSDFFKGIGPSNFNLSETGRLSIYSKYPYTRKNNLSELKYLLEATTLDITEFHRSFLMCMGGVANGHDESHSIENKTFRSLGSVYNQIFDQSFSKLKAQYDQDLLLKRGLNEFNSLLYELRNNLQILLRQVFCRASISQLSDQQNVLSELSHLRRASILGLDGLTHNSVKVSDRDIHTSYYSKLCPIETPEGKGVGVVSNLSFWSRIGFMGLIESPYWNLSSRRIDFIPNWMEKYTYLMYSKESRIVRYNTQYLSGKDIGSYVDLLKGHIFSVSTLMVPFLEHDDGNRVLMGANMQKQAVTLINPDPVLVGTGYESFIYQYTNRVNKNQFLSRDIFHLDTVGFFGLYFFERVLDCFSNKGSVLYNTKAPLSQNRIVSESRLGKNLFIGFLSMGGDSFEDSIVANTSIVTSGLFESVHFINYNYREFRNSQNNVVTIKRISLLNNDKLNQGVIRVGSTASRGQVLISGVEESYIRPEVSDLKWIKDRGSLVSRRNEPVVYNGLDKAIVIESILFGREIRSDGSYKSVLKSQDTFLKNKMALGNKFTILTYEKLLLEYILLIASNILKYREMACLNRLLMCFPRSHWIFILCYFVPQLYMVFVNLVCYSHYWASWRLIHHVLMHRGYKWGDWYFSYMPTSQLPKYASLTLVKKGSLVVGDKLTGRHGNKGVVSKVYMLSKMPYLESGMSLDLALNPIGISSRMNVGQVLETHLGLASISLASQIRNLLYVSNWHSQVLHFRNLIGSIYSGNLSKQSTFRSLSMQELSLLMRYLCNGIPYTAGAFSGYSQLQLDDFSSKVRLDSKASFHLRDGLTGSFFRRGVNVGYMHIIKLVHQVQEKIYARSSGPSHIITGQPLGGKSNLGGQRIGEMEVWAFEAYGAAFVLHELFVAKSDNKYTELYKTVQDGSFKNEIVTEKSTRSVSHSFHLLAQKMHSICIGFHFTLF